MALDLSALDAAAAPSPAAGSPTGEPLRAPLNRFFEDPDQPRKQFDEEALKNLAEDIKQRGVMSAVLVCPPLPDGRMKIIQGARRFRASDLAGAEDLPYVIKEDPKIFDDYSQVAENVQREPLTPMELALFIAKRIEAGDKQAFIARKLAINKSDVAYLMTLTRAPSYIVNLYETGKCQTPKYLYELENLDKDHPAEVKLFCETSEDFRGKTIAAFSAEIVRNSNGRTNGKPGASELKTSPPAAGAGFDSSSGAGSGTASSSASSESAGGGDADSFQGKKTELPFHNPDIEKNTGKPAVSDPTKIKKPLLLGSIGKRAVMVLLYKRPSGPSMVFVKYEDGSGEEEVQFSNLKGLTLTEASA